MSMRELRFLIVPLLCASVALAVGCPDPDVVDDAGAPTDAGTVDDDGGAIDDADSGTPDAGAPTSDAGAPTSDAGVADAGPSTPHDAGAAPDAGTVVDDGGMSVVDAGVTEPAEPVDLADCFATMDPVLVADYAQYDPTMGTHCDGTQHQDFTNVERVVFVGDSVTAGTPPTLAGDYYRNRVAHGLADRLGLDAPGEVWERVNVFANGQGAVRNSGDFSNCAQWGARTDDLPGSGNQIEECFPAEERGKNTLIVSTIGGNDLASIADDAAQDPPRPDEDLWLKAQRTIDYLEDSMVWLYDEGNLTGDVKVVLANVYEYTDGTGDLLSCPAANGVGQFDFGFGFDANPQDPELLMDIINHINAEYMRIATERGIDMVFMREAFCGHGFQDDNEEGRCYLGLNAERWFDLTCIHPTPDGHGRIAQAILRVIDGGL